MPPDEIVPARADAPADPAATDAAPVVETTDPEPAKPHPLQPGGVRYTQLVDQRNRERERAAGLETEARMLREQLEAVQRSAQSSGPKALSLQEIQAAHDRGEIDAVRAADLIADTRTRESETRILAALAQQEQTRTAATEIRAYVDRAPALNDSGSPEFRRVRDAAVEIAAEMRRPMSDPLVQRRALREALGPVEKLTARRDAREFDRRTADAGVEMGGMGSGPSGRPGAPQDPLTIIQKVDPNQWAFWEQYGVPMADRKVEAKYVEARLRTRGKWPA